jgi:hypothetical protein
MWTDLIAWIKVKLISEICRSYGNAWYDGYLLMYGNEIIEIYNPRSVVNALLSRRFSNYWTQTETYEALKIYIDMDYSGLRDAVVELLAGGSKEIDTGAFANDMVTFAGFEDVLTLLVHLGYLGFDQRTGEAFVPNREVAEEFERSLKHGWGAEVAKAIKASGISYDKKTKKHNAVIEQL